MVDRAYPTGAFAQGPESVDRLGLVLDAPPPTIRASCSSGDAPEDSSGGFVDRRAVEQVFQDPEQDGRELQESHVRDCSRALGARSRRVKLVAVRSARFTLTPDMDQVAVLASIGAAFVAALAALGGVALQATLDRRTRREQAAARLDSERAERVRTYRRDEIRATRISVANRCVAVIRWAAGAPPLDDGAGDPLASWESIGDPEAYRDLSRIVADLQSRRPGSMPTREDMIALGDAQDRADRALREQELRVLRDLPLREIDPAVVESVRAEKTLATHKFMDTVEELVSNTREKQARALAKALVDVMKRSAGKRPAGDAGHQ